MIQDVRLFQVALADLVHVLADSNLARQKNQVNQHLTAMLKPTRSVITNYDLAENLQHNIINGTSHVIGMVKTYNSAWEELGLKNKQASENTSVTSETNINQRTVSKDTSDSKDENFSSSTNSNHNRDLVIDSAVVAAMAAGLNENNEFDLTKTPLHEQLFTAIDELALTFSNAVANHLTSLQPGQISSSQPAKTEKSNANQFKSGNNPSQPSNLNIDLVTTTYLSNENLVEMDDRSPKVTKAAPGPLASTTSRDKDRSHTPLSRQAAVRHKSNSYDIASQHSQNSDGSSSKNPTGKSSTSTELDSLKYLSKSPPLQLQGLDSTESHSIDKVLARNKYGVDKALDHLKYIVKYSNLIIQYIESRSKSVYEYGKNMSRNISKINHEYGHQFLLSTQEPNGLASQNLENASNSETSSFENMQKENGGQISSSNSNSNSENLNTKNPFLNLHHHNLDESWIDNQLQKIEEIMSTPETLSTLPPLYSLFDNMVLNDQAFAIKAVKLRDEINVNILNPLLHMKHETERNISILNKYWNSERNFYASALKKYEKSKKNYQIKMAERGMHWEWEFWR